MHALAIGLAVLLALSIIGIGAWYLTAPLAAMRTFGLPLPGEGANVAWWLRLKGSRDVVSGLVVFGAMALTGAHVLGVILLILALIPVGDMLLVLSAGGSKKTAFGVHGATVAAMVVTAAILLTGPV